MTENNDVRINQPPQADELLDLLTRQHDLYRQLRELAAQQSGTIAAEDPSALLDILSRRQSLIDELAEINQRLEPVRADWKRIESMLTTSQRQRAGRLVEQVGELLAEILASDEADSKMLSARKVMTGQQITQSTASAQVQAAYQRAAGAYSTGSKFDRSTD